MREQIRKASMRKDMGETRRKKWTAGGLRIESVEGGVNLV